MKSNLLIFLQERITAGKLWGARSKWLRDTLAISCLTLVTPIAIAGQLSLATAPTVSGGVEPKPNIILTVDDSGSMSDSIGGTSKITLLKNAITATLGNTAVIPDGRIRLAWQAMHDNGNFISGNGAMSIKLGAKNSMKVFSGSASGTHRANFNSFVSGLSAGGYTPSHDMFKNVFTYMNAPEDVQSPWADDPTATTAQSTPYLACRRTVHIFMTDGLWNSQENSSCNNGGTRVGTSEPPVCSNSKITCPSGYTFKTNSDPNKVCRKGSKNKYQYTAGILSPNTSEWSMADRVTTGDGVKQDPLPDGKNVYDPASTQVRIYKDNYGDDVRYSSTLSDIAFRNWSTDLQNGGPGTTQVNSAGTTISGNTQDMLDDLAPSMKVTGNETVTASGSSTVLEPFWNPKNDSATWQHITQYTIGFGAEATSWGVAPAWGGDTYSGDYAKLVNGIVTWPDVQTNSTSTTITARAAELWHSAINGRGEYIPASDGTALTNAFLNILQKVAPEGAQTITVTTSSSTLKVGTNAFVAGYNSSTKWSGSLGARPLNVTNKTVESTELWNAATLLDDSSFAVGSRFVLSYDGTSGISWITYSSLPSAQQTPLNKNSAGTVDSKGQDRVNYIRGDRTKEAQSGGVFRDRTSRLGDIVNSNIWYVGKPASGYSDAAYATFRGTGTGGQGNRVPMVYVGANDGMLHGVAASTTGSVAGGTELLAYIPQGIAEGDLRKLTDTTYTHQYFVDGSPYTSDAFITTPTHSSAAAWTTVLVGTLGLGGKGYFVLDATSPTAFTSGNAGNLVLLDKTDKLGGTRDADIGVITSPPVIDDAVATKTRQVVKMNNDRWALVLGNGYNSTNEAPVLLIQYLDGDKALVKISPCVSPIATTSCNFKSGNGLSGPLLIDLNGDGKVDVAYAGDLLGNVWKFNLTSATSSDWNVGFSNQPLFVAKGVAAGNTRPSATVTQSITTPPYSMPHPLGGHMVVVGTGRNLTGSDVTSTAIDTFYGIWDNSAIAKGSSSVTITDGTAVNTTGSTTLPTTLIQQTITSTITDGGATYYASSANGLSYSTASTTDRGWYLDLKLSTGERVLINTRPFDGNNIMMTSTVPKTGANGATLETCAANSSSEVSYFYFLDYLTGKKPTTEIFDLLTSTSIVPNIITMPGDGGSVIEDQSTMNKYAVPACPPGKICEMTKFNISTALGKRVSWRKKQ